ncbi:MAG: tRNA preQ1(34) S-adenosylmethionine ribosyltransferase-isomerase QueA [Acidobacteriota bacterium]|nr:tRNA preQ1(34) S-adenosylmethionine ribosyltransferase-isomerase QueA [Acidobacteriota bacterium]
MVKKVTPEEQTLEKYSLEVPERLIAQEPPAERDGARMLVVDRARGSWEDRKFRDFPEYVETGDCVVLNDSRVLPSRLFGRRPGRDARIQVFLTEPVSDDSMEWLALVRPGRKVRKGETILFPEGLEAEVIAWGEHGERRLRFRYAPGIAALDIYERLERIGHMPLPPYIHRQDTAQDRERYQTVFSRERGSVAAPTAGLHFTEETLEKIRKRKARLARVTLHVGLGTFQPIYAERLEDHRMHAERYSISEEDWRAIEGGHRVIAVGSTSVRSIESAAATGRLAGETDLFIRPGYRFQKTGAMLTNFHLPRTSLLVLVCAFAGTELALAAYRHAVRTEYRFFSYGDCMLIL